ncbi:hypothetical protein DM02DRAFT_584122 [Periconia macrospinosa]|uniref:Zn(2)-C6 fungal-type domain-containing protein n=1 Tax=Periconia macrospinosa TaxID=97972 RepID=A0A2V1E4V5_9PLEO|nr:hypothetical protein DM02DRAFT_584122 [Periconia macrospinosa]
MQDESSVNNLRAILPRAPDDQHSPQIPPGERRIRRVTAACELCRQRRVKCDAARPSCTSCISLDQECVYRTTPQETSVGALKRKFGELESHYDHLKTSQEQLEQLFRAIRTRPDGDAKAIFESIRSGADVDSIVRHIDSGDLVSQLRVVPERRFRFEFPFKGEMPRFLQAPDNLYLKSPLHEAALAFPTSERQGSIGLEESQYTTPYVKPYFTAAVVDPRLDKITPSKWTQVSQDDESMRLILRSYFLYDYQFVGCFHKDDFLDDMLSGSEEHCTPLLVNTVLAIACHSHEDLANRSDYWDPQTLGYKFFAEAKRLWEIESMSKKSLPTLQAALIFNVLFNVDCMDMIGLTYQTQAIDIAHEIDLFNTDTHVTRSSGTNSRAFTLWCLYWWMSIQDYHFEKYTPKDGFIAGRLPDPGINLEWYGETWLQYPHDAQTKRIGYGYLFKAKCELAMIMDSACAELYGGTNGTEETRIEVLTRHIDALRSWYASLPPLLSPKHLVYPSQLKLHMLYQDVMIRLCEIVVTIPSPSLAHASQNHPQSLLDHSRVCFETLMRLYYLRHGFEGCDAYLIHYLHVLAYIAQGRLKSFIDAPDSFTQTDMDDARATLFLAAKGLYTQSRNYYLALTLFCVLQNDMRLEEANMLYKYAGIIRERSAMRRLRVEYVLAQYPIYIARPKEEDERKPVLSEVVDELAGLDLGSSSEESDRVPGDSQ